MNGEFIRAEELKISPFDHGFLYGAGFFETFRTYEWQAFCYLKNIWRGCILRSTEYRIAMPYDEEEILAAVQRQWIC